MEGYSNEIIVFSEQLFRIEGERLDKVLHRSIGCLTFLNKYRKMSAGSAFLISNQTILTGAHNIYDKQFHCQYTDFKFYMGVNGMAEEYHQVEDWRFPQGFKTCKNSEKLPFDYAVMKLKEPIYFDQYLTLSVPCETCLFEDKEKQIGLFGFPYGYQNFVPLNEDGSRMKLFQYGLTRKNRIVVIDAANFKIGYGISTLGGQSGCPVAVGNSVIAIHVGGDKGQFNVGRIIDSSLILNAWKWISQFELDPFYCLKLENYSCFHGNQQKIKLNQQEQKIKIINLIGYHQLLELHLEGNQVQQIDISPCPLLVKLYIKKTKLCFINLTRNANLIYMSLPNNNIKQINVSANIHLTYLNLVMNEINQIDVSNNISLTHLDLYGNRLKTVDVSLNKFLTRLSLSNNNLKQMDVSTNINLTLIGREISLRQSM